MGSGTGEQGNRVGIVSLLFSLRQDKDSDLVNFTDVTEFPETWTEQDPGGQQPSVRKGVGTTLRWKWCVTTECI